MPAIVDPQGVKQLKVTIATPVMGDSVHVRFALDLARLVAFMHRERPDVRIADPVFINDTYLPTARFALAQQAQKMQATHLLYLDADMAFPSDALERLLGHNVPFVAANYTTRRQPYRPVAAVGNERIYTEEDSTGLQEVDWVGFGVSLIDMDVFTALPSPWFATPWGRDGGMVGEDVFFCALAQKHGFKLMIDHDLSHEVKHMTGNIGLTPKHAVMARQFAQETAAAAALPDTGV